MSAAKNGFRAHLRKKEKLRRKLRRKKVSWTDRSGKLRRNWREQGEGRGYVCWQKGKGRMLVGSQQEEGEEEGTQ